MDPTIAIIGAGPAGCSAAVMASSLNLDTVLIDPAEPCQGVQSIGHLQNVLGYSSGRDLADRAVADLARAEHCRLLRSAATRITADDESVTIDTSGGAVTASHAIVAAGVRPATPGETDWVNTQPGHPFTTLTDADPTTLTGQDAVVLGADRPLGTMLRSYPNLDLQMLVLYPPAEQYKAAEVAADPRVTLLPTTQVDVHDEPGIGLDVHAADGTSRTFPARLVFTNLGVRPALPAGDIAVDDLGYCPPQMQHPRILTAGDCVSPRHQRIAVALGAGAYAALTIFYALNGVGTGTSAVSMT